MKENSILSVCLRYLLLVMLALFGFKLIYAIFLPLTIYPLNFLLSLFYDSSIAENSILIGSFSIILIEACIAGSAYFLLLMLNFSLPMRLKTRIYSLIFSILVFLSVNILRIFIFSILLVNSFKYFNLTHLIFWYIISAIIVFFIWLATIKLFKIKKIPFYTDIKFVYSIRRKK